MEDTGDKTVKSRAVLVNIFTIPTIDCVFFSLCRRSFV